MGMGSYLLAGALSGVGAGMAQKQKMADEERRDAALSALRRGEIDLQYQKAGENQAASDQRNADRVREERSANQQFQLGMAQAGAKADERKQASRQEFELRKARLDSALRTNEEVAKIAAEAKARGNEVQDVITDGETGAVSVVFKNGASQMLKGVIARPRPTATSDDAPLLTGGAGRPTQASAQNQPKIATRAQLEEMAKQSGMSVQDAEAWARGQGWTIR